ncbi:MAG: hypothetical protein WEA11_03225 [Acidimicrobiales bacterium]
MKIRQTLAITATAIALLGPIAACSSDSSSNSTTSTTVTSGDQITDAECPFTGTVATSSGGKAGTTSALGSIVNAKDGCADNIQLNLGASVGAWTAAYATGPVVDGTGATVATQGAATLVITLAEGTWSGIPAAPTTVLPVQLDYVKSINVVNGSNGSLLVVFGLSTQKPYVASDSQNPAYITLGIG